jgi:hypothetical protein
VQPTFCSAVSSFLLVVVVLLLLLMVAGLAVAVAGASSALPSVRLRRDRPFALTTATPDRGRCVCSAPSWALLDSFESIVSVARQATRRTRKGQRLAMNCKSHTRRARGPPCKVRTVSNQTFKSRLQVIGLVMPRSMFLNSSSLYYPYDYPASKCASGPLLNRLATSWAGQYSWGCREHGPRGSQAPLTTPGHGPQNLTAAILQQNGSVKAGHWLTGARALDGCNPSTAADALVY